MKRCLAIVCTLALIVCGLSGCGGTSPTAPARGSLSLTIKWPTPTRLIPTSSQSITVLVDANGTQVGKAMAVRPYSGGTSSTLSFPGLPVGTLTVSANAFASTNGSGVSQAFGQMPIQVTATGTAQVSLSLGSTVAQLVINPQSPTVTIGTPSSASVTAFSAVGDMVLLTSAAGTETISWSSSSTAVLSATTPGLSTTLTGLTVGTSTLAASMKVRDDGTTVTGSTTVTVTSSGGGSGTYHIIDLGAFDQQTSPTCINDNGQVAGATDTTDGFFYSNGTLSHISAISGYGMEPLAINDQGQVAGTANNAFLPSKAFLFAGSTVTDIGNLGNSASALAIDSAGDIYGISAAVANGPTYPFKYSGGVMTNISTQLPGTGVNPVCVNDDGDIAGFYQNQSGNYEAFLYSNGSMVGLGDLGSGTSKATLVNGNHQVVGYSPISPSGPYHAFLYQSGAIHDLGTVSGRTVSLAFGINNAGQIVGTSGNQSGTAPNVAFVYSQAAGMKDLNTLVDSTGSGWVLNTANAINTHGWIAGQGTNPSGFKHGFLAIPN